MKDVVMILGGYGFLGTCIARRLKQSGYKVISYGRGNTNSTDLYDYKYYGDITLDGLKKIHEIPGIIINCAGTSSVSLAEDNFLNACKQTVESNHVVLEYVRGIKGKDVKYIYVSSAAVYGDTGKYKVTEDAHLKPQSIYGIHKLISEQLCEYYSNKYSLNISIVRPFSINGIGLKKQLLWDTCNKIGTHIYEFWGTGKETRDWVDVRDVAELIFKLIFYDKERFSIFNACSGIAISNREFLEFCFSKFFISKEKVTFNGVMDENNPEHLVGDNNKAKTLLLWMPRYSWKEIIANYITWYKDRTEID